MFARPPRLTPEMARPDQFHRLPGVMWHGNYDPSSLTRADGLLGWDDYNSVGVHAGTRRAAMDALDVHGEYDPVKGGEVDEHLDIRGNGGISEAIAAQEMEKHRVVKARGGGHGFLHPVLPEKHRVAKGLVDDAGDDWSEAALGVNSRLAKEALYGDPIEPDEINRGVRYKNLNEHPGSTSVLLPNTSMMQHSDYVRAALEAGRPVHPLTKRLYDEGLLDSTEARRYMPVAAAVRASDAFRKRRTERVSEQRRRPAVDVSQQLLPFVESQ